MMVTRLREISVLHSVIVIVLSRGSPYMNFYINYEVKLRVTNAKNSIAHSASVAGTIM